jgi:hypothetical protein
MILGAEQLIRVEMRHPIRSAIFLSVCLPSDVGKQVQGPADGDHGDDLRGDAQGILEKKAASAEKQLDSGLTG